MTKKATRKRRREDPGGGPIARVSAILAGVVAVSFVAFELVTGPLDRGEVIIAALIVIPTALAAFATLTYDPDQRLILLGGAAGGMMSLGVLAAFGFGIALLVAGFMAIMAALRVAPLADRRATQLAVLAGVGGAMLPFLTGFFR